MPRQARRTPGGMVFHVLNRAVDRMPLFANSSDYNAFEQIIRESHLKSPIRILSYCLMPNHWHFVFWPDNDHDLGRFLHRLTTTHAIRWRLHRGSVGRGHIYQGRFKSFPVETEEYLYHVLRYTEGNALRAGLAPRAEDWPWGSLAVRLNPARSSAVPLSDWPVPRSGQWLAYVNEVIPTTQMNAIRTCIAHSRPYGSSNWAQQTAKELGIPGAI